MRLRSGLGLVAVLAIGVAAAPLRVALIVPPGGTAGVLQDAVGDLKATVVAADAWQTADVLAISGEASPERFDLPAEQVEAFVNRGGGLFVVGVPASLTNCAKLWAMIGSVAPADVVAADLFPEWRGDWIWIPPQEGETADHIRYIRKSFQVEKPVKRAYLRVTVDNLYWVYLNGEQIGYHWSWYDHELYDLAAKLRQGKNVIAIKGRNVDGPGGLCGQLAIEYEDGTREELVTDKTWRFSRQEAEGWTGLEFDDSQWGGPLQVRKGPFAQGQPRDRLREVKEPVALDVRHPALYGCDMAVAGMLALRGLRAREGATVIARTKSWPLLVAGQQGKGRVLVLDAFPGQGSLIDGQLGDDLLAQGLAWLAGRGVADVLSGLKLPASELVRPGKIALSGKAVRAGEAEFVVSHEGKQVFSKQTRLRPGEAIRWEYEVADEPSAEGEYQFVLLLKDEQGRSTRRDARVEVKNPVNLKLSVPANRYTTAEGFQITFKGVPEGELQQAVQVVAGVTDPSGEAVHGFAPQELKPKGELTWELEVPRWDVGEYQFATRVEQGGKVLDESRLAFWVVGRLDLADFYPATMRLSRFKTFNPEAIKAEIEDIIAHGFNTLTFSGRRLGAPPNEILDFAEDYAQRRGMAVSYSFQRGWSILRRDGLPEKSVFSDEYEEAIRPLVERTMGTARLVPRLLNVQGYMDEPFQVSGKTFDDRPPARAEFKRRYGIEMPTREQAMKDPELWLKYVEFWSDCFAQGWRKSYKMVKAEKPHFWVELTHDSHCTFGAAGRDFKGFWAVDDVFHWGAHFDSVNYDIYPYLSTDFRNGEKFRKNPLPRIAGVHMAFDEMRNLAYTYDRKLGFWLESELGGDRATTGPRGQAVWSPRELTYTAVAAGCDYLNTFWGIPQNPKWWETYRGAMNEIQSVAPLLTRSKRRAARACWLFPRTQHVLYQQEYWNVMVGLEAFRRAYGELDCVHEEQVPQGKLRDYDVLCLLDVHCLPAKVAAEIARWVNAGGVLIADLVPTHNEQKQELEVFERLFGVRGSGEVQEGSFEVAGRGVKLSQRRIYETAGAEEDKLRLGDGPLATRKSNGKGLAYLVHFPVKDVYLDALIARDEQAEALVREALMRLFAQRPPRRSVHCDNPNVEAALRETREGTILLFLINHEGENPRARVRLNVPGDYVALDLVTKKRLRWDGKAMELECPWGQTRLVGFFPGDPKGVRLAVAHKGPFERGTTVKYVAEVGRRRGEVQGNYMLDVTVTDPGGQERAEFSRRTCTSGSRYEGFIALPVNAPRGTWTIGVRSWWDEAQAQTAFEVR